MPPFSGYLVFFPADIRSHQKTATNVPKIIVSGFLYNVSGAREPTPELQKKHFFPVERFLPGKKVLSALQSKSVLLDVQGVEETSLLLLFTTVLSQWDFSHGKIGLLFIGESQLRQSRANQPTVRAGHFSVSIIHRTLTWTTGSLTCAIAHGSVRTPARESALKVDSGRKIPCHTGESNLCQRHGGPMLYQ